MPSLLKKQERIEFFSQEICHSNQDEGALILMMKMKINVTQCTRRWNFAQGVPNSWTKVEVTQFFVY